MDTMPGRNGGTLTKQRKGEPPPPGAGRPPKSDLLEKIHQMIEGDGFANIDGELLDAEGNRTGQMVKVRASIPNNESAARAWLAAVKKGSPAHLKMFLEYKYGRPKQQIDVTSDGKQIGGSPLEALSPEKQAEVLRILNATNT